jgi:hypothetical protein
MKALFLLRTAFVSAHRGELGCFALGKAGCFWLDFCGSVF